MEVRGIASLDLNPCLSTATAVELFVVQVHWNNSSWKICSQNFPEFWKGAAEEVQSMYGFFFWLVDWLAWLGFWGFFCFSQFYRTISLCLGDVPGPVFLLHLLLWAGPGVSPVKRALGWLMLLPALALVSGSCPGEHPSSVHSCPEPFRLLKSTASIEGRKWAEPGEKVISPVPGIPQGRVARCKTKPWCRREAQRGCACSVLFLKPPCLQVPTTKPSTASLHLLFLSEMCLQQGGVEETKVMRHRNHGHPGGTKPPHSRKPIGKEGFDGVASSVHWPSQATHGLKPRREKQNGL